MEIGFYQFAQEISLGGFYIKDVLFSFNPDPKGGYIIELSKPEV